jgi:hypothetical protein
MSIKFLSPLVLFLLSAPFGAHAQTINASSCSATDVQSALNSVASSGTTVVIPAGNCTWTTTVTYNQTFSTTIQGQSKVTGTCAPGGSCTVADNTIIVDNLTRGSGCGSPDNAALMINTGSSSTSFRLTGITFQFTGGQTCSGSIRIAGNSQQIRVDHNHFNQQYSTGVSMNGWTLGVIDHNFFEAPSGIWNGIKFQEPGWNNDSFGAGDQSWASATQFGTNQLLYVENNEFHSAFTGATAYANDCTQGGRYVWRFNLEVNTGHQTHPTGGGQRNRGCRATEIYQNADTGTGGTGANFNFFFLSSGPSLIWGNTVDATFANLVSIHSMRRDNKTYTQTASPNGWGYCGTSLNGTGSGWDQNSNASTGYRCLDQPGQGVGQLIGNDFPSIVNKVSGSITWPQEALEPVYEWLDTSSATTLLANYEEDALFPNSDYYLYTASFNGTSGTGSGTLASRPSTCTTGVAYWATDQGNWNTSGSGGQGQLFKCTATNTWTLYYTPYTYPHPLTSSASPPATPSAPVSLKIVAH